MAKQSTAAPGPIQPPRMRGGARSGAPTVKQQREQRRQEKVAAYQREQARSRRARRMWWSVASVAVVALVAAVVVVALVAPRPASYRAGASTGVEIDGVETFENAATHVNGTVDYPQTPPAGGPHAPVWLNCGIYTEPQPNENAVHALEHGAVWVTYDADAVSDEDLAALRTHLPSTYVILSPFEGLDSPIVLSAWNAQLKLDDPDDARIPAFFTEYWRSQFAPEPNAACTGGITGPGLAS